MTRTAAIYPSGLSWRHLATRLFAINEVLVVLGAVSLSAIESMGNQPTLGLPYYFLLMQCVGLTGLVVNGGSLLWMARRGWRRMDNAAERYMRHGLFRALPVGVRWQLLMTCLGTLMLSSWLAQELFAWLVGMPWARALPQDHPPYTILVFNLAYGAAVIGVFEHLHHRAALSEAREKLAQRLSAEAQLNLLRSQLDPHMLFNTLSNLYELIDENPGQARALLVQLVGFLRATLSGSRAEQHSLAQEFKLVADYLALMQVRMGDRLQSSLTLPEPLSALEIPSMLLQPLVENAIKHGLEKRKDGGMLGVYAHEDADELVLTVRNSGEVRLLDALSDDRTSFQPGGDGEGASDGGFGLHYVRRRLHALYGDAASLDLRHLPAQNLTEVTLRMPLRAIRSIPS